MKKFICKAICFVTFNKVCLKWCADKCCKNPEDCKQWLTLKRNQVYQVSPAIEEVAKAFLLELQQHQKNLKK